MRSVCFYNVVAPGEIALAAVFVGATAFGGVWRWRNGRLRAPRPRGRVQAGAPDQAAAGQTAGEPRVTAEELGAELGERATLLQFSSAFCAPCRATRRLLTEVAGGADGVTHIEVDVDDRLDLVRLLGVRRTPTVFVLGPDGRITRQASGQPRREDVLAAVALVQGAAGDTR